MGGFWHKPREQRWRGWVFQIHLWSGLIIGIWAALMGLSGSALVFKDELEAMIEPRLFVVEPQEDQASLDAVAAEINRRFPEHIILNFRELQEAERSHVVRLAQEDEHGRLVNPYHVHYNQYTGGILGGYKRHSGFFGWLEDLHFYLLAGRTGLTVNGVLAAALLLMCLTGILIWWPGFENWKRGFNVKWSSGWKRINYDLHRATGIFAVGVLAVMGFTGFYFAFPRPLASLMVKMTGGDAAAVEEIFEPPRSDVRRGAERYSIDALVRGQEAFLPPGVHLSYIAIPNQPEGVYTVAGRRPGNPALAGFSGAYVDQYSGIALQEFDSEETFGVRLVRMFGPIHFGEWGGPWSQALWLLLGLVPSGLFGTGFLMWWNRVAGKRYRAWRKRQPFSQLDPPQPQRVRNH